MVRGRSSQPTLDDYFDHNVPAATLTSATSTAQRESQHAARGRLFQQTLDDYFDHDAPAATLNSTTRTVQGDSQQDSTQVATNAPSRASRMQWARLPFRFRACKSSMNRLRDFCVQWLESPLHRYVSVASCRDVWLRDIEHNIT